MVLNTVNGDDDRKEEQQALLRSQRSGGSVGMDVPECSMGHRRTTSAVEFLENRESVLMEAETKAEMYVRKVKRSINMRDIGGINGFSKGLIYRSSEIISDADIQGLKIRAVLDLRRPPAHCRASVGNIGQFFRRLITSVVVWFRHKVLRRKAKVRRTKTLVDEEELSESAPCQRCCKESSTKYGVEVMIYHVDVLPSAAVSWIFYELPLYVKAKTIYMKITGNQAEHMVADAVADPEVMGYVKLYKIILSSSRKCIASALRLIMQADNLPLIVHCQHGKDRTGIVVMILHLLCGVPYEDIIQDYAISEVLLREGRQNNELHGMPESLTTDKIIASAAEVMEQTLYFMEKDLGGVEHYLESAGMTAFEIQSLKDTLTDATTT